MWYNVWQEKCYRFILAKKRCWHNIRKHSHDSIVFKSQLKDRGHHLPALECICANIVFLSSFTPWLSGIFTGSVLVIVLSFCSRPAVTTVFSHTVWAKPRCDSDFQNSVCVTVPGSPVPPQKQTWFSFPKALMGPLFSPCCSTSSSLYKFIFGEFFISFFFLSGCSCSGDMEMFRVFVSQTTNPGFDGCHVSSRGFCLWQSLSIWAHTGIAHCAVT